MPDTNITILYLDDEEVNLFLFKANFKKKFKVLTAVTPQEALNELDLHHNEIIVVITDMRMPVMNGIDFVRKAREKYNNIFYYILTGYDYNEEIEEAMKEKIIQKCFTKPFDSKEIEQAVVKAKEILES